MYVLVRKDFAEIYRAVQGGHALAAYALKYPIEFREWKNSTLVYLGIWYPIGLSEWEEKLKEAGKSYACFYEPDQNDAITGIACYDTGEIFKELSLA